MRKFGIGKKLSLRSAGANRGAYMSLRRFKGVLTDIEDIKCNKLETTGLLHF